MTKHGHERSAAGPSLDAQADRMAAALDEWDRTNLVTTWLHSRHPEWGPMGRLDRPVEARLIAAGALTREDGRGLCCTEVGAHLAARLRAAQVAAARTNRGEG